MTTTRKEKATKPKKDTSKRLLVTQKVVSIGFLIIFATVLTYMICFNWIQHCANRNFLLPNIVALLISLLIGGIVYLIFRRISITKQAFRIIVILTFLLLFILQLAILYFSFFKTGWDAGLVDSIASQAAEEGIYTTAGSNAYLTKFTNNIFTVSIFAFIKSLPVVGSHYFTILAINALMVNLAGLFACLTLKKLISEKAGILSIMISAPLLLLSPWIIIPYTDTLSMVFPILIFYIYVSTDNWWKFGLIFFFALIGFFIKPTTVIALIAILLIEMFRYRPKKPKINKDFWLRTLAILNGIIFALLIKYVSFSQINYQQVKDVPQAGFIHFMAMGQNEETCGQYHPVDHQELDNGTKFEWQKFCDRISNRSFAGHINFFSRKLLLNFDDGTFAWGREGSFYKEVPERNNLISKVITSFYYNDGNNYKLFEQLEQMIWLFVLFGCIFSFCKSSSKEKTVLQLSLIGVFFFVMLFEARARYLLCFAPMFIVCAMLGYHKLINVVISHKKEKPKKLTNGPS